MLRGTLSSCLIRRSLQAKTHIFHVSAFDQDQQRFETRLLPTLTRSYPRHFTFYVAEPLSSIRMSPLLIKISKDFATLFTTIDPIGNVAIFAGLTASLTRAERHR